MLQFVSNHDELTDQSIKYYIRAEMKSDYHYGKEECIDVYLNKFKEFLAEISQTIPSCKGADWLWADYCNKQKKIIQHGLIQEYETVKNIILKHNKNDSTVTAIYLHTFYESNDNKLQPGKFVASYFHNFEKADYEVDTNHLELSFSLRKRDGWPQPLYTKQDILDIVRLIYRHYDVKQVMVYDDLFKIRFPNHPDYYEGSYAVFPHRTPCVWMLGLPHKITGEDMPETAEFIPINDNNTLCISNRDDWFTSFNSEHVQKANFLEITLWQKGLLPAIY